MVGRVDYRSAEAATYRLLYNTPFWKVLRAAKLHHNPQCQRCRKATATVVHHIRDHKGDRRLFFMAANLMSVCAPCHDGPIQQRGLRGYSTEVGADGWPLDPMHPANR